MLGLKLETDPVWVKNVVGHNIAEILTDHAWCEQKAATHAISLIVQYSELEDLVTTMTDLAQEEMSHFKMVHEFIKRRGFTLGPERRDDYVGQLMKFAQKGGSKMLGLLDKLLLAAMIEARSCERFRVISDHVQDKELADFYYELMASEARHYTTFLKLAKKYFEEEKVDARWQEWLVYEAEVIRNYGKQERIHG